MGTPFYAVILFTIGASGHSVVQNHTIGNGNFTTEALKETTDKLHQNTTGEAPFVSRANLDEKTANQKGNQNVTETWKVKTTEVDPNNNSAPITFIHVAIPSINVPIEVPVHLNLGKDGPYKNAEAVKVVNIVNNDGLQEKDLNKTNMPLTFLHLGLPKIPIQVPDDPKNSIIDRRNLNEGIIAILDLSKEARPPEIGDNGKTMPSVSSSQVDITIKPLSMFSKAKSEAEKHTAIENISQKLDKMISLLDQLVKISKAKDSERKEISSKISSNYWNQGMDPYPNDFVHVPKVSGWNNEHLFKAKKYSDEQIAKAYKSKLKKIRDQEKIDSPNRIFRKPKHLFEDDSVDLILDDKDDDC